MRDLIKNGFRYLLSGITSTFATSPQYPLEKGVKASTNPCKARIRTQPKIARNAPCPCGSGAKNKNCCKR